MFPKYSKKFEELKSFDDWLQHEKEGNKIDMVFVLFILLVGIALVFWILGYGTGSGEYDAEEVACSAVGMEALSTSIYKDNYCVDSNGTFHRVVVTDGKVYIDK